MWIYFLDFIFTIFKFHLILSCSPKNVETCMWRCKCICKRLDNNKFKLFSRLGQNVKQDFNGEIYGLECMLILNFINWEGNYCPHKQVLFFFIILSLPFNKTIPYNNSNYQKYLKWILPIKHKTSYQNVKK